MRVAVAIITDPQNRVLITQRALGSPHGGLWEFPGGKLEENETPSFALIREIKEEVGLDVIKFDYLGEINHRYSQEEISLLVYHVTQYDGEASCVESQMDLCWVDRESLSNYNFPAANINIIHLIQQKIRL
jgi:8-oxo-dGTP diphosphatase